MYEPHNFVIQLLYSGGILSTTIFAILIFMLFKKKVGRYAHIAVLTCVCYLSNMMFGIIFVRGDGHLFSFLMCCCIFGLSAATRTVPKRVNARTTARQG